MPGGESEEAVDHGGAGRPPLDYQERLRVSGDQLGGEAYLGGQGRSGEGEA